MKIDGYDDSLFTFEVNRTSNQEYEMKIKYKKSIANKYATLVFVNGDKVHDLYEIYLGYREVKVKLFNTLIYTEKEEAQIETVGTSIDWWTVFFILAIPMMYSSSNMDILWDLIDKLQLIWLFMFINIQVPKNV